MISIDAEKSGDHTDALHVSLEPGQMITLKLIYHDDDSTAAELLASVTDAELAAELSRRLEAR